jgi:hypothetical protein
MYYVPSGTAEFVKRDPSGALTVTSVPSTMSMRSVAYNPADGNVYGFASNRLIRVEAEGGVTELGAVTGMPEGIVSGATFDDAGVLRAIPFSGGLTLYTIDVATLTATALPLTSAVGGDLVEIGGSFYALRSGTLARIDPTTGVVTQSAPLPGFAFPSGYAMWSMDGHLYMNWGATIAEVLDYATPAPTTQVLTGPHSPNFYGGAACATAGNPFLNAEADDFTATTVYAGVGGSAGNVFGNDTLNGAAFAPAAATSSVADDGGLTGVSIAADGALTVPASATAGTYAVDYRICETAAGRTNVCDTATATVAVQAAPVVTAVNDDFTATAITTGTAGTAGNVLIGDTIDGAPVTPADVTATITDDGDLTGAALTADGDLTVPAEATQGTYTVTYQICATVAPTACDTATASVRVAAVLPPPTTDPGTPGGDPGTGASGGGSPAAAGASTGRGGPLASTGYDGTSLVPAGIAAGVMALAGAALLLVRRRRTTNN